MPCEPLLADVRVPPGRRDESLSMALTYRPDGASSRGAIVASPLPFLGGDMENNVVRVLARSIAGHGLATIRYDYRSVGDSHDAVPGEPRFETWRRVEETGDRAAVFSDAEEALRRARRFFEPAVLAGYSFGCLIAVRTAHRLRAPVPLVLVAPPLTQIDIADVAVHGAPVLLVFGGSDHLAPAPVADELHTRFPAARAVVVPGADHFFRDHEAVLETLVRRFLVAATPTVSRVEALR